MNFELKPRYIAIVVVLGVALGYWRWSHREPGQDQKGPITLAELNRKKAFLEARQTILQGVDEGLGRALLEGEKQIRGLRKKRRANAADARETGDRLTILFTGNVRGNSQPVGELEPAGGLQRRRKVIEATINGGEAAKKCWGPEAPIAREPILADAGDMLHDSANMQRRHPDVKQRSKNNASTLMRAAASGLLDVANVGEIDLAFGPEFLDRKRDKWDGDFVSANLEWKKQADWLQPAVRVERRNRTLALTGLANPEPRIPDYYETRDLVAKNPEKALTRVFDGLRGGVDARGLLSNLGVRRTEKLIRALSGKLPHFVIASHSNKLTADPEWVKGIPVVEPLSRGKYLGRIDLYLNGDTVDFRNIQTDFKEMYGRARRLWSTYRAAKLKYFDTHRQLIRLQKKWVESKDKKIETEKQKRQRDQLEGQINYVAKDLPVKRSKFREKAVEYGDFRKKLVSLEQIPEPTGDDWIDIQFCKLDDKLD